MTRLIPAFAMFASPAFAHPGDHSHAALLHMLTEPDHLALIALGTAVLAFVVYLVRKQQ